MKLFARIFVAVAWCIPGRPHRWAVRLLAERKAGLEAVKRHSGD